MQEHEALHNRHHFLLRSLIVLVCAHLVYTRMYTTGTLSANLRQTYNVERNDQMSGNQDGVHMD